ncbi:PIN/TRAM domain-containing protein [Lactococcus formosensis subsp. formosensis]|uniref:PIN/TRAM domain-containing protein n=1 Tax=Lactococcus formosensis TaxID=1281486 RepID=UPI0007CB9EB9|nr:PIN/TRAM domain-containing protein [Lactococcus formosensis]NHI67288.1 PIN/TRAM domain-containing protein [Lactococcus garvieae]MDT2725874.1 PIN/TRAM domain-containing protein [Lactococcus formosensis]NHI72692.1 PIN/TRAM domain-containing protein [Lactococcus garvieae]NHI98702.1 PIN/TRAM domain-containing protein [Lactococcus garvieae]NHJ18107.1 PIN/TRAM domain-containing protein [Lactococcus garvieae]
MRRWIIHVLMGIVGASLGITTLPWVWHLFRQEGNAFNQEIVNGLIGAIIFVILSFFMSNLLMRALKKLDQKITRVNLSKMVFNFIGAILGLTVGVLLTTPLSLLGIPVLSNIISFVLIIGLLYLGYTVFDKRGDEIFKIVFRKRKEVAAVDKPLVKEEVQVQHAMILDTSSVIDGRILDVLKTGFISDKVIVPNFVLLELQLISDSADPLKRAKGRRGLDLVNSLKEFDNVEISNKDYKDIREVDTKLLRYASEISAKLVTNDFNLNKVAEIQGVIVLNINDLANAVKTQLVVGEQIEVTIIREGSERQQGVAYLPDGTMIVIEDTAKMIDQKVLVEVAKVLQTSAGRMIFAELVNAK